jgi:hypothetical protein
MGKKLFAFGETVATPGALEMLNERGVSMIDLLMRHGSGDWGDMSAEDRKANGLAVKAGGRVFSAYNVAAGGQVWVITEADRSVTTFLLPEEY